MQNIPKGMSYKKIHTIDQKKVQKTVAELLTVLGEDIKRDGLKETPRRMAHMYNELLGGYKKDPKSVFKMFNSEPYQGLIVVSDISFFSLCEHHMVPFYGKIHIGYLPNGKILGLSKFVRLVEIYARRLQIQERLTRQIDEALVKYLEPHGVIVYCEAEHLCMSMRGVKNNGSVAKTLSKSGNFMTDKRLVEQFFLQIAHPKKLHTL